MNNIPGLLKFFLALELYCWGREVEMNQESCLPVSERPLRRKAQGFVRGGGKGETRSWGEEAKKCDYGLIEIQIGPRPHGGHGVFRVC
jgi:hypothetical protein